MFIKGIVDEDFVNYKLPSMYIAFPECTLKCNKACGKIICHNTTLLEEPNIKISYDSIVKRYLDNDITKAIVVAGMDPLDTPKYLIDLVKEFRKYTNDDIVIYTGYYEDEIFNYVQELEKYPNIIVKYGRFFPDQAPHYDEVLGVNLASDNQYAERIS